MKFFRIGIAGSGNLAWHLAQDLEKAGHVIPVIYSRNQEKGEILSACLYDTEILVNPDFSGYDLDVLFLAVSDDAIQPLSNQLVVEEQTIVVHCAGSVSMSVLEHLVNFYGVFYPLQSFTTEKGVDFRDIPVCIEASSSEVHNTLYAIGKSLGCRMVVMDSGQRRWLHLAAVFTSNFTNHMLFQAKAILDAEGIDFSLLRPLAKETIEKAFLLMPELAQTGPAARSDKRTLQLHQQMLEENPELSDLYRRLSASIRINSPG
jgi:predicted short-subunit dehydrogenase-like oxidoreductase (DUF2520 family)